MPDWSARLRGCFAAAGRTCDDDVLEELSAHAAAAYDGHRAEGADAATAERRVDELLAVWVTEASSLHRPSSRSAVAPPAAGSARGWWQDVAYAVRLAGRSPGTAAAAVLTMTIGIASTLVLFSVADGLLMKPLPWPEPERLMRITEMREGRGGRVPGTVSNGTYLAWQERHQTIVELGGWRSQTSTMTGVGEAAAIEVVPATASLFRVLGARPLIGRLFTDDEGEAAQPAVALLSHGLWAERFGERDDIVGRVLRLNDVPHTVVGVMPRDFAFPDRTARVWTAWRVPPVQHSSGALVGVIFRAIARLSPGGTSEQAAAEATTRARTAPDMGLAARALFGAAGPIDVAVVSEVEALTADVKPAILVLSMAVVLLLATATGSVAGMQLARVSARRRELAVRVALGAGLGRIARQLVVESGVVAVGGTVLGVVCAWLVIHTLPDLLPDGFPRIDDIAVGGRTLAVAVASALAASVACGLLAAWQLRRLDIGGTLAEDGAGAVAGAWRTTAARMRAVLMSGQVAIACILLVGATLLGRSLVALQHADRGFDPSNVLTARLPMPPAYPGERRAEVLERLVERVRGVPGVTHAAYATGLPLLASGGFAAFNMRTPDRPDVDTEVQATQRLVSPDYFAALRLRVLEGRALSATDTAASPPVVVVNRTFARQYLASRAVGVRLPLRGPSAGSLRFADEAVDAEIVGVVDDTRDSPQAPPQPEIFASLAQIPPANVRGFDPVLVIRTAADPVAAIPTLRGLVAAEAPTLALDAVSTMEDRVATSLERPRLYAIVLIWFATAALIVAVVGLFGLLSFAVAQRTREFGVRTAMGAHTSDLAALVVAQAAWIVVPGLVVGIAAALAGGRALEAFLFGVSASDLLTVAVVAAAVAAVAGLACLIPARRASRIDPLAALREG